MDRKSKDGMPRYQQIALDIATQIVKQQYKVGDRIYARSSLASKYHVSPETARRAICLLADMDIVEAEKGSGVVILSVDNAARYLQQLTGVETMTSLRQSIRQDLDNQLLLAQQLREAGAIRSRKMFGEYGLYCDGIFFAVICDDQLFVKVTPAGEAAFPQLPKAPPYEGAKDYLWVEDVDDRDTMTALTRLTCLELQAQPKKRRK